MKKIFYLILAVTILISCSSNSIDPEKTPIGKESATLSKSCINAFIINPKFDVTYIANGNYMKVMTPITPNAKENYVTSGILFDQLCAKYKDESFNDYYLFPPCTFVYADEFISIDITCDQDFDAEHQAGTSLADITMMHASSPYKFIKSGYKEWFDYKNIPKGFCGDVLMLYNYNFHPIYKLLSEVQIEDMLLLNYSMSFTFTKPRPAGKQTYTITLKTKDKTFESKVTIE